MGDLLERFRGTDLYVVITESFCAGRTALDVLDRVLEAGVGVVQLREKQVDDRELLERARAFRERTRRAGALLIVDDRLDVALAAEADGVGYLNGERRMRVTFEDARPGTRVRVEYTPQ